MGGARELTTILGAPPPGGVAELPDETLGRLARQIAAARTRQSTMLDDTIRQVLRGAPLPVRTIIRKALAG